MGRDVVGREAERDLRASMALRHRSGRSWTLRLTGGFTGESWYACQTFMQSMMTMGLMLAPWSLRPRPARDDAVTELFHSTPSPPRAGLGRWARTAVMVVRPRRVEHDLYARFCAWEPLVAL